jgi:hypothetical protein
MTIEVVFAKREDEEALRGVLWEHGMDISGDTQEHLVVKKGPEVLAGGKLSELQEKRFYLEVIRGQE